MLVLNIRVGESLHINDDVEVQVLNVAGTQVKIGVHAPREVSVYREEIYNRIRGRKKRHKRSLSTSNSC